MSKIGDTLGYSMDMEASASEPMEDPLAEPAEDDAGKADAEVLAMKQFERAKTPEAKVEALKAFLEACGVY